MENTLDVLIQFKMAGFKSGETVNLGRISKNSKEFNDFKKSKAFNSINFNRLDSSYNLDMASTEKGSALVLTFTKSRARIFAVKSGAIYTILITKATYEGNDKSSGMIEYCDGALKPYFHQIIKNGKVVFTSGISGGNEYMKTYKQCVDAAEDKLKEDFLGDIALMTNPCVGMGIRIACAINPDVFD
jgi:hypothetical protein